MHYWNGWHMGWMPFWWLCGAVVVGALIWLAVAGTQRGGTPDSPEQILKRRYAGGEIPREDYERKLEELRR
jgi:putative membrane protein